MEKSLQTQIVGTIGPASSDDFILEEMIKNGLSIARLNLSWGDYDVHKEYIEGVRIAATKEKKFVPILIDLSGPRVTYNDGGHGLDENVEKVFTDKDRKDVLFAIKHNVEYIALSFVGGKQDILELREFIRDNDGGNVKIIAKIERREAVKNIAEILEVSDGVMIARGDLGNEFPLEEIPFVQKKLVALCNKVGKFVIVATEMMPSMVNNNKPSRSDVTDVTNAVLSGADAVMFSNETTVGKFPVETIIMAKKIINQAEKYRGDTLLQVA